MRRTILATALISCALIMVPAAANATEMCVVDTVHHDAIEEVSHQEYQYKKIIPGTQETFHTEYRFQTRTKTFGWVEHAGRDGTASRRRDSSPPLGTGFRARNV